MTRFVIAFALLPALTVAADLTITIKDIRSSSGSVYLALYDKESSFLKPPLAKGTRKESAATAAKGEIQFLFHDLPAGKYAVTSYHDENGNGKLDTNPLGIPTEGVAFSNNARIFMGPPSFSDAAFDFDAKKDKSISISLAY